jgi:prepilin signal peptidase PulO-like enzyme (type II secretory pathway)
VGVVGKLIAGKDAMGYGDVKLFAMIGATLGVTGTLATFVFACVIGTLIGGGPMIVNRVLSIVDSFKGRRQQPRPSLLQAGLELFPVEETDDTGPGRIVRVHRVWFAEHGATRQVHHMPFGPSIALAALLVVIFQHPLREGLAKWIF